LRKQFDDCERADHRHCDEHQECAERQPGKPSKGAQGLSLRTPLLIIDDYLSKNNRTCSPPSQCGRLPLLPDVQAVPPEHARPWRRVHRTPPRFAVAGSCEPSSSPHGVTSWIRSDAVRGGVDRSHADCRPEQVF
jgi:hypothetical protein